MVGARLQLCHRSSGVDLSIFSTMSRFALEPIIKKLLEDGVFGNVSYLDLETDDTGKGVHSSSDLAFVNLTVNVSTGKEVLPLFVKLPFFDVRVRESRNIYAMFHNEVAMYKEILPDLGVGTDFYPKMFYGLANNGAHPEKDVLVLENLKYKNFLLAKNRVFIDIYHIYTAIKKIAEFHSFSFVHKHKDMDSFLQMTKKLKSVDLPPKTENEFNLINAACIERGIKPLLKDNVSVDLLNTCLNLLKYPLKTRGLISFPEEPFAVICHGDFCNNNILYKFDENNKPVDCVFVDFQFSMYGSPAIDIFFFLYLNTTSELREEYWDSILKLYWDTLRKCVPAYIIIPSYEDFLKHFAERVIYGYTIAAFYLPVMMANVPYYGNDTEPAMIEERIENILSTGGKEAERRLVDIVLHLLDKNYIRPFIEFCKNKKMNL